MPMSEQKQALLDAVTAIRSAQQALLQASRNTSDAAQLIQINTEYTHLDSCLSQLLHAQALSDDAEFGNACIALKTQSANLQAEVEGIDKVIKDVALAGKVVGFVAQAAKIIATM